VEKGGTIKKLGKVKKRRNYGANKKMERRNE
jgi:hypothetical protein